MISKLLLFFNIMIIPNIGFSQIQLSKSQIDSTVSYIDRLKYITPIYDIDTSTDIEVSILEGVVIDLKNNKGGFSIHHYFRNDTVFKISYYQSLKIHTINDCYFYKDKLIYFRCIEKKSKNTKLKTISSASYYYQNNALIFKKGKTRRNEGSIIKQVNYLLSNCSFSFKSPSTPIIEKK